MSVIRSLVVLLVLVIVIPLGASFLKEGQAARQEVTEQKRLDNLARYTVTRGDVQRTASALGTIEAESVVDLGFETSGQAAEVLVKTGDSTLLVQEIQIGLHPTIVPAWPLGTRLGLSLDHAALMRVLATRRDRDAVQVTPTSLTIANFRELT